MKKKILKYSLYFIGIIFMISIPAACHFYKVSGSNPDSEMRNRFKNLFNYADETFRNTKNVFMNWGDFPITEVLKEYWNRPKTVTPSKSIPSVKTDLHSVNYQTPTIVWFGHSSYLVKYKQMNILVDPVFSGHASPFSFLVNAFEGSNIYTVDDMPKIDVLVLTHDHYDHLDHKTVMALNSKVKQIICPLGVDSHLNYWGIDTSKVKALNWYESVDLSDTIRFTAVPTQHFSGRSLSRNKTLWAAYSLDLDTFKIFIGCDGGYSHEFKKIGEKFGPYDLALLENGQYNQKWHSIHCYPEETAQIGLDLKAKTVIPIHWAKFTLALHPWNEPINRLLTKADSLNLKVSVPKIGEPYSVGEELKRKIWWDFD